MFKFKECKIPHIYFFGAGGTGGFALEMITRLLGTQPAILEIFDKDNVEDKNLERQNFTHNDLDKSKAQQLAEKVKEMFSQPPKIHVHKKYLVDSEDEKLSKLSDEQQQSVITHDDLMADILINHNPDDETLIFISAVDNIDTRMVINKLTDELKISEIDVIVIDSGNSHIGGQATVYANYDVEYTPTFQESKLISLPTMFESYPELLTADSEENPAFASCADNVQKVPQAMMANIRNADIIANIVNSILENKSFAYNCWESSLLTYETRAINTLNT